MIQLRTHGLFSALVVAGLLMTSCAAAAPTGNVPAAAPTDTPAAEAAAPTGPFTPTNYEAPDCNYGGEMKKIEAVDELTVKFTLCQPDPAFLSKIAFVSNNIQDADYLEATGGTGDLIEKPNGTGPYKLSEWRRGDQVILTRNDEYWGDKAIVPNLIFRWGTESAQRLVELQAGTVDGISSVGADDFETVKSDSNLQLLELASSNVFYLGMNNTYPPFDNEKVRQAFAMAIDRDRLVKNFYPPASSVAKEFMPPSIYGYTGQVDWYKYDPEQAKKILTEEGVLPGFKTTITYRDVVRGYLPSPSTIAQDLQAQLADIGVEAEIVVMESGAFLDAASAGQLDGFHMLGWGADYPDATNFLDVHFGPGASKQFGTGFQDIWDVLKQAGTTADQAARLPLYSKANELIKQHVPMIPIAHGGNADAFKADVEGAYDPQAGAIHFALLKPGERDTFVWMQNAEPISMFCGDETDGETLGLCEQFGESLMAYKPGGNGAVIPSLATEYSSNADLTEWTFTLRPGVKFHNGASLDANDVVVTFAMQWDVKHPLHKGRSGDFTYFSSLFGPLLNAPK
ncbi:MAG: ABC transporter substrate-binding protein [Caldilineaceae bacterium]